MTCPMAHRDGAYVLGSLSPSERQQFEQHLADCVDCGRSVQELAGLPGLLARVDVDVLTSPPVKDAVPDTLLPELAARVRRAHRRRDLFTAGLAAAAAAGVVVLISVTGTADSDRESSPTRSTPTAAPTSTPTPPPGQAMTPVGETQVRARVALEPMPWGTRLDLTCSYAPGAEEHHHVYAATYSLFVRTTEGRPEQVAMWRSIPGRTMRLAAATAANPSEIVSVQMRTTDGKPVLQLIV